MRWRVAGALALLAWPAAARPVVAIIDSGIAATPALKGRLIAEHDLASPSPRPAFRPRYDHGTMVATILDRAADSTIDIVSLRIDDPAGCPEGATPPCQGDARPIAAAIRLATRLRVQAINISLAMADDPDIAAAVGEAARAGIPVVMAAGNMGLSHPSNLAMARAGYPAAVLVGATTPEGAPWPGSNRPDDTGGYDYVWQPGVRILTRDARGRAVTVTGTSFAVPVETARRVAGLKTPAPVMAAAP